MADYRRVTLPDGRTVIVREADGATIPIIAGNRDYEQYLKDLAEGATEELETVLAEELAELRMLRALRAIRGSLANIRADMTTAGEGFQQAPVTSAGHKPHILAFMQATGRLLDRTDDLDQLLIQWINWTGTDEPEEGA